MQKQPGVPGMHTGPTRPAYTIPNVPLGGADEVIVMVEPLMLIV
jgi:hypothetical protein